MAKVPGAQPETGTSSRLRALVLRLLATGALTVGAWILGSTLAGSASAAEGPTTIPETETTIPASEPPQRDEGLLGGVLAGISAMLPSTEPTVIQPGFDARQAAITAPDLPVGPGHDTAATPGGQSPVTSTERELPAGSATAIPQPGTDTIGGAATQTRPVPSAATVHRHPRVSAKTSAIVNQSQPRRFSDGTGHAGGGNVPSPPQPAPAPTPYYTATHSHDGGDRDVQALPSEDWSTPALPSPGVVAQDVARAAGALSGLPSTSPD